MRVLAERAPIARMASARANARMGSSREGARSRRRRPRASGRGLLLGLLLLLLLRLRRRPGPRGLLLLLSRARRGLGRPRCRLGLRLLIVDGSGSRPRHLLRPRSGLLLGLGLRRRLLLFRRQCLLRLVGRIAPDHLRRNSLGHPRHAAWKHLPAIARKLLLAVRKPIGRIEFQIPAGAAGQANPKPIAARTRMYRRGPAIALPLRDAGKERQRLDPGAHLRRAFASLAINSDQRCRAF